MEEEKAAASLYRFDGVDEESISVDFDWIEEIQILVQEWARKLDFFFHLEGRQSKAEGEQSMLI